MAMKGSLIRWGIISLGIVLLTSSCRYKQKYYQKEHIPMRELKKSIPDSIIRDTFWRIPEPIIRKPTLPNLH